MSLDIARMFWCYSEDVFYYRQQNYYVYIVVNVVISYMVPPAARPTFNK